MKKFSLTILLLISAFLLVSNEAHAQWNFEANNSGGNQGNYALVLPFTYSTTNCKFDFDVISGNIIDLIVDNSINCDANHFLVIDGYKYQFTDDFDVTFDSTYIDFRNGINLGVCSTTSGAVINVASPFLFIDITAFQLDEGFSHQVKKVSNEIHFIVETSNHDIVCEDGVLADLVYKGGFE